MNNTEIDNTNNSNITQVKGTVAHKVLTEMNARRLSNFASARMAFVQLREVTQGNPFVLCPESFQYQIGFPIDNQIGFDINNKVFIFSFIKPDETYDQFTIRCRTDIKRIREQHR